jgi:hypothetical protein
MSQKILAAALAVLTFGALSSAPALRADENPDKPQIDINFDDDASSLSISAAWKEDGKLHKETFSYGKDMYLTFSYDGKEWVQDSNFHSRNWEAFLYPDATGFLLMERQYDGHRFENISLAYFQYYPSHRTGNLRPANGSPWWSPDGAKLALVEPVEEKKAYNVTVYDVDSGRVLSTHTEMPEKKFKASFGDYNRARICDDEMPCETPSHVSRHKTAPAKKKKTKDEE